MALLLGRGDVEALLDMRELIDAVEGAQVQYSLGKAVLPMRSSIVVQRYSGDLELMPGYLEETDTLGVKVLLLRPDNAAAGIPIIHATILLHDAPTGRLLGILDGASVTAARTAAASGVATRHLARPEARSLGILGAGRQGRTHLWAMVSVRPIRRVRVFDRSPQGAARFKEELEPRFGVPIEVVGSPEEAVHDADIVAFCTTSSTPLVSSAVLPDGVHITAIGAVGRRARELDTETICRSKLVVDSREAAFHEAGEILVPLEERAIGRHHIHAEIGEIACGLKPGRTNENELTVYRGLGLAIQDLAAARLLYEKALATGAGIEVDI